MRSRAISKNSQISKVVIRRPQGSRRHTDTAAVGAGRGTGDRPARSRPAGAASGPLGPARSLAASQTPAVLITEVILDGALVMEATSAPVEAVTEAALGVSWCGPVGRSLARGLHDADRMAGANTCPKDSLISTVTFKIYRRSRAASARSISSEAPLRAPTVHDTRAGTSTLPSSPHTQARSVDARHPRRELMDATGIAPHAR